MSTAFFISDTHFGHANILTFKDDNGDPVRVFRDVDEMNETMVRNWNSRVAPTDRVYHLGDVAMHKRDLPILDRLNGRKVLIKGNHDIEKLNTYAKYFDDVRAYRVFPAHGIICSHIPIHPGQLDGRFNLNVHGHMHVRKLNDSRYINISVEQTNYFPVTLEQILKRELTAPL